MEELMTIEEYVKKHPKISAYRLRTWMKKGLKYVPERPFLIKEKWVEEYIENCTEESIPKKKKGKITKLPTRNNMRIEMEDLM